MGDNEWCGREIVGGERERKRTSLILPKIRVLFLTYNLHQPHPLTHLSLICPTSESRGVIGGLEIVVEENLILIVK